MNADINNIIEKYRFFVTDEIGFGYVATNKN